MSKPSARKPTVVASGYETSIPRTAIAAALVVLGIAWIAVYINVAQDAADSPCPAPRSRTTRCPWMADLEKWNYLIGFGLIFLGLVVSAHKIDPARPRPRRGGRHARLLPDRPGLDRARSTSSAPTAPSR